jgi:hypothetical protein
MRPLVPCKNPLPTLAAVTSHHLHRIAQEAQTMREMNLKAIVIEHVIMIAHT